MKILHTGDLHLDSAFCGGGESYAQMRRERQRQVLKKIFSVASDERCDMILIAGDFFDTSYVTPETKELCISLFRQFDGPVVVSAGNHDPLLQGSFWGGSLPENVRVFNSTALSYFEFKELGVAVGGYSFTSSAMTSSPLEREMARPRTWEKLLLLCAHADLDSPISRYAPVMSSDIRRLGFDYAALGHVHNPPCGDDERIRYCGFAEGRSFDEIGDGGVLIIELDENGMRTERVTVSEYRYVTEELDVSDMHTREQISEAVSRRLSEIADRGLTFVRLELCGIFSGDEDIDVSAIESLTTEGIADLQITDATLCLPDKAQLEKDTSLKGEFYRSLRQELYSEDASRRRLALRALRIGLSAIDGRDFTYGGNV